MRIEYFHPAEADSPSGNTPVCYNNRMMPHNAACWALFFDTLKIPYRPYTQTRDERGTHYAFFLPAHGYVWRVLDHSITAADKQVARLLRRALGLPVILATGQPCGIARNFASVPPQHALDTGDREAAGWYVCPRCQVIDVALGARLYRIRGQQVGLCGCAIKMPPLAGRLQHAYDVSFEPRFESECRAA